VDLPYRDRAEAGRALIEPLNRLDLDDPLVLGLPRGGVAVAKPVAEALHAPLDLWCVRKVGMPGHRELAIGAVAGGGTEVLDPELTDRRYPTSGQIADAVAHAREELAKQERALRGDRAPVEVAGRTVVVVDDGLATGSTARAAGLALRQAGAARVVLAVPVASREGVRTVSSAYDDVVCPAVPSVFYAVGQWYYDFGEVTDDEVLAALTQG